MTKPMISLLLLVFVWTAHAALQQEGAALPEAKTRSAMRRRNHDHENTFRVRALEVDQQQDQEQREAQLVPVTFSEDGAPVYLDPFWLDLSPVSEELNDQSLVAIQMSLQDYFLDSFTGYWVANANGVPSAEISSVSVTLSEVTSTTRNRRLLREERTPTQQQPQNRRLIQGASMKVDTIVEFTRRPTPSDSVIQQVTEASLNDIDTKYVPFYLVNETAPQLAQVSTASVSSSSSNSGNSGATTPTAPPTLAPTVVDATMISQANQELQNNSEEDKKKKTVLAATSVGLLVFVVTVLGLAYRRQRIADIDDHSSAFDMEGTHVSVDYDGKMEQEELYQKNSTGGSTDDIDVMAELGGSSDLDDAVIGSPSRSLALGRSRSNRSYNGAARSIRSTGTERGGTLQTVRMEDGETTLHIPPTTSSTRNNRVYDVAPMIVTSASSIDSSFDETEYHRMMRARSTGNSTRYTGSTSEQYSADQSEDGKYDPYGYS